MTAPTLAILAMLQIAVPFDGPAPPVPPAVISRDSYSGRATLRAVRLKEPLRIDGKLDEDIYSGVPGISEFVQMEPHAGSPATERTELWIFFDDKNVYVAFRCWESQPERMVVHEMRRDNANLWLGENIAFMFDTFYDRRNGVEFGVTPSGGRYEGQITNERQYNGDWNPIWDVAVARFSGGWTVETAIPFKSLRYRPGRFQTWGFQARRINAWKNELSFLTALPPALGMGRGIFAASLAPTLVGIEAPPGAKNLEIKPYIETTSALDGNASETGGLDVKYGITQNLTADFTYRPDFAQVEADEEQINLTRFSLLFPEKREFFRENQGLFTFGGSTGGDTPILFYSRQIGINNGSAIPIQTGERLTGRIGLFSLGALHMKSDGQRTSGTPGTDFSVFRLKHDLLHRSSVGMIFTRRAADGGSGSGTNQVIGFDGAFAFFRNLTINTYWAKTRTSGMSGQDTSYRTQLDYAGDRYGFQLERLAVGADFNPEIGFVRRNDIRKSFAQFRFSPRPRRLKSVRKFSVVGSATYIENGVGHLESRVLDAAFTTEFQTSDLFWVGYNNDEEYLPAPFAIASTTTLPIGRYGFGTARTGYSLGPQRKFSGIISLQSGNFYDGHKTSLSLASGRTNLTGRVGFQPTLSFDQVRLREGRFQNRLMGSRVTYALTPMAFFSALIQYNSTAHSVASNVRLRWEYKPGSELFIVYNQERDTQIPGLSSNRAFVLKINRVFRF